MIRNAIMAVSGLLALCFIVDAQSPAPQVYPPGTYHGYYHEPYPNYFLRRTPYESRVGPAQSYRGPEYYLPPYRPAYEYSEPTYSPGPTERVSPFPYGFAGRDPTQVPEVGPSPAYFPTDNRARVRVLVPADATVWFDGAKTQSTGSVRVYQSPRLSAGDVYTYTIRATWRGNGREVTQSQAVDVRAGTQSDVVFPRRASSPSPPGGGPDR
jgi:uncharacterized protein (TIGR03000 family)